MFLKMNYTVLVQKVPLNGHGIYVSIKPAVNKGPGGVQFHQHSFLGQAFIF